MLWGVKLLSVSVQSVKFAQIITLLMKIICRSARLGLLLATTQLPAITSAGLTNHLLSGISYTPTASAEKSASLLPQHAYDGTVAGCVGTYGTLCFATLQSNQIYETNDPPIFMQFDFSTAQTFASAFISTWEIYSSDYYYSMTMEVDDQQYWSGAVTGMSTWVTYTDYQAVSGTKLKLMCSNNYFRLFEFLSFSSYPIQFSAYSVQVFDGSVVSGSALRNAFDNIQMKVHSSSETGGTTITPSSPSGYASRIQALFPALFPLEAFVTLPMVDQTDPALANSYTENNGLWFYGFDSSGTTTGSQQFFKQNTGIVAQPEWDLGADASTLVQGFEIAKENSSENFGFTSFGVMTTCACANTLTDGDSVVTEHYQDILFDVTRVVIIKGGAAVYLQFNLIKDSFSLLCGDVRDGYTFCGARQPTFDGEPLENVGSFMQAYDDGTQVLTLQALTSDQGGTFTFQTGMRLVNEPSAVFTQTASLTVIVPTELTDTADGSVLETLSYQILIDATKTWQFETQDEVEYTLTSPDGSFTQIYTDEASFDSCEDVCVLFDVTQKTISVKASTISDAITLQVNFYESGADQTSTAPIYTQSLELVLEPCVIEQIAAFSDNVNLVYKIGSGPRTYQVSNYTQTPQCNLDLSLYISIAVEIQGSFNETLLAVQSLSSQELEVVCNDTTLADQSVDIRIDAAYLDLTYTSFVQVKFSKADSTSSFEVLPDLEEPEIIPDETESDFQSDPFSYEIEIPKTVNSKITSITSRGLVTITFDERMKSLVNLTSLIAPLINDTKSAESLLLLEGTGTKNENAIIVSVKHQPGIEVDPGYTGATVQSYFDSKLEIQLNFTEPAYVSSAAGAVVGDQLTIKFTKTSLFTSLKGLKLDNSSFVLEKSLPRQIGEGAVEVDAEVVGDVMLAVMAVGVLGSSFVLKLIMSNILALVDPLTSIAHYALKKISYPANVTDFLSSILPFITFDLLPESVMTDMFSMDNFDDDAVNDSYGELGYEGKLVITNIGSVFFTLLINLISVLFIKFAHFWSLIICRYWPLNHIQKYLKGKREELLWNGTIDLYHSNYFFFSLLGWIGIKDLRFGAEFTAAENFSSGLAVVFVVYSVVYPFFIIGLLLKLYRPMQTHYSADLFQNSKDKGKYHTNEDREDYLNKYAGIVSDLKLQKRGKTMFWVPLVSLLFKFVDVLVITQLYDYPSIGLGLLTQMTLGETWLILHLQPFQEKTSQHLHLFNTVIRLLLCYTLFLFTPFVPTVPPVQAVGNVFLYLTVIMMAVNIINALVPVLGLLTQSVRRCKKQKRDKKHLQKLQQRRHEEMAKEKLEMKRRAQFVFAEPKKSALKHITQEEQVLRFKQGQAIFKVLIDIRFQVDKALIKKKIKFEIEEDNSTIFIAKVQDSSNIEKRPKSDDWRLDSSSDSSSYSQVQDDSEEHTAQTSQEICDYQLSSQSSEIGSCRNQVLAVNTLANSKQWPQGSSLNLRKLDKCQKTVMPLYISDRLFLNMADPSNWGRFYDRAFIPSDSDRPSVHKDEKDAYVHYLNTVLEVTCWDQWPAFEDPLLTAECSQVYERRLKETQKMLQKASPLVKSMAKFQVDKLKEEVSNKIIKRGMQQYDNPSIFKLSEEIEKLINKTY